MSQAQSSPTPSLAELRAEIDRIDDSIHDAIMRRAELVGQVRAAKPPGMPTTRPAREAQILRRLLARHSGQFPQRSLVQIWQEMIDAFTFLQGSLHVAADPSLGRLVRDRYGVLAEITWEEDTDRLLAHAAAGEILAVLPWPGPGHEWWVQLAAMPDRPVVFSTLPFLEPCEGARAVAVGRAPCESSGDDRSWIVVAEGADVAFEPVRQIARAASLVLLEVDEFVAMDDPRLTGLTLLGTFPAPYMLTDAI